MHRAPRARDGLDDLNGMLQATSLQSDEATGTSQIASVDSVDFGKENWKERIVKTGGGASGSTTAGVLHLQEAVAADAVAAQSTSDLGNGATQNQILNTPHTPDRIDNDSPGLLCLPEGGNSTVFVDYANSLRQIASWPVWKTTPTVTASSAKFRIAQVTGKGMGMLATRRIKAGELIFEERPLYVQRSALFYTPPQDEPGEVDQLYCRAVDGLSSDSRAAILALHNNFSSNEMHPVRGILRSNFLELDIMPTPKFHNGFVGLFPTLSRANHDCTPNTNYFFSFPRFVGQIWAARDIAEGEEITIIYSDPLRRRSERQLDLKSRYGFDCMCCTCTLPKPASIKKSDTARERVGSWIEALKARVNIEGVDISQPRHGADLAKKEGLAVHYAQVLYYGGIYKRETDSRQKLWRKMLTDAREAFCVVEGKASYNVRNIDQMLQSFDSARAYNGCDAPVLSNKVGTGSKMGTGYRLGSRKKKSKIIGSTFEFGMFSVRATRPIYMYNLTDMSQSADSYENDPKHMTRGGDWYDTAW